MFSLEVKELIDNTDLPKTYIATQCGINQRTFYHYYHDQEPMVPGYIEDRIKRYCLSILKINNIIQEVN